jgi:septal ring factor EnvC (AmiA/AmiB activator)
MRFLILVALLILSAPAAMAQAPVPRNHPTQEIEEKRKATEAREKELKDKMQDIKSDLKDKKQDMISVARDIKQNEKKLLELEAKIDQRRQEQLAIEVRLNQDKGAISNLVLALERVRRVPPEALLARPGAPLETAQSAMLLQSVLPRVYDRAEGLKSDLDSLKTIMSELKENREKVIKTAKQLETNHKKLASIMSSRKHLYAATEKNFKIQQAELKQISLQATNLKDLVARIEKKQQEENNRSKKSSAYTPAYMKTPVPKAGEAQLPISGIIKVSYGKTDEIGAVSQGLKIEGRKGALVVAPMGGVVDYAGPFKGYGQIVILRHQKGYHSLIAGLDKIDTVVGRAVSAGEPLGQMASSSSDGNAPVLYYELRYKGHPVNPSKKISGLR